MAKWSFAVLVVLSAGAQANGLAQRADGCVVVNEIIYQEVTASGWGMTGADLVATNFREPRAVVCTSTLPAARAALTRKLPDVSDRLPRVGGFSSDGAARTVPELIQDN
jgi:hypothetical protein